MRNAQQLATMIQHADCIARLRFAAIDHITREKPGMAAGGAVGGFSIYADNIHCSGHSGDGVATGRAAEVKTSVWHTALTFFERRVSRKVTALCR